MNAIATTHEPTANPFGHVVKPSSDTSTAATDATRAVAEVQAAMVIARRFPRNQIEAMDRILNSCTRTSLAEGALYTYSRGGQEISGPSIRLAEVLAQQWGNIQFGIRELEQRFGESTVEAFAWDVETNVRQTKIFQVKHERHTRTGAKKLEDPRDIYEMVANQGARRLRACILGVIPGDVVEAAVRECERTMTNNSDVTPETIKKLVDAFTQFGVTPAQIEKRIQCRLDAIRPAQVVALKKVYASLRDGMGQVAQFFEVTEPDAAPEGKTLAEKARAVAKKTADQAAPAAAPAAAPEGGAV